MAQKARKEIADFLSVNKLDRARIRVSFRYAFTIAIFLQILFETAKINITLQKYILIKIFSLVFYVMYA